ncbi:serine/threonine-protein kinase [Nannocystis pusilla]|uniref:serine/threonine-protein kinase n=1 Tax=Nannocystis pusilla TaxID=889268 RepID=UPI003B7EAFBA
MEYLEGEDLDHMLQREGPLPWARLANMAIQICSGLSSAHAKGTYHRDIKPQNCFRVTLDRNPDHIKLIDFGIAKDTNSGQELTQDGVLLGTPEYMAPELIATNATPDARSDIYAVGATLYKLITGTPPFSSKNVLDLLYHQSTPRPRPRASGRPIATSRRSPTTSCSRPSRRTRTSATRAPTSSARRCSSRSRPWSARRSCGT